MPIELSEIAWMDVISDDISRSFGFYTSLFGWEREELETDGHGDNYSLVKVDSHVVAGAEQVDPQRELAPVWTVMAQTDDAADLIGRALAAGGQETFPLSPMTDLGQIAMILDPWGATIGLWQPGSFRPSNTPAVAGRLVGAHLGSPEPAASLSFYANVFGWDADSGAGTLDAGLPVTVHDVGGPSKWTPVLGFGCFGSVPESVAAAGGSVISVAGSQSFVADPMGATFLIEESPV